MKKVIFKKFIYLLTVILIFCSVLVAGGCGNNSAGTWIVSSSAPTAETIGNVGDMYLDTSSYDIYQKTDSGWMICGNIKPKDGKDGKNGVDGKDGINGTDGATWLTGESDPKITGVQGKVGDIYLNTKTLKTYRYVKNGTWEYFMTLGAVSEEEDMFWKEDGALKILMIGNSFSEDTSSYLWKIADSAGIDKVIVGNLNIGGAALALHLQNAKTNNASYIYQLTGIDGQYKVTNNYRMQDALKSENWDFISLQQVSGSSGLANTFEPLEELISIIRETVKDNAPYAKFVWNMTWAYQSDSTHNDFLKYERNQMTMYNAIVNATKTAAEPLVDLVSPTGTGVQNARNTELGDTLTRDGFHLSGESGFVGSGKYNGRYIAGLTFFGKVSGIDLSRVTFAPNNVTDSVKQIAIASAAAAIETPYSVYQGQTNPQPETFLEISWTENAQYVSNFPVGGKWAEMQTGTSQNAYFATQKFTKTDIPVGSVIILQESWVYRPEGWINGAKNSERPEEFTTAEITVDESWWGQWTERAFNIRKADNSDLTGKLAEVSVAFKIRLP